MAVNKIKLEASDLRRKGKRGLLACTSSETATDCLSLSFFFPVNLGNRTHSSSCLYFKYTHTLS